MTTIRPSCLPVVVAATISLSASCQGLLEDPPSPVGTAPGRNDPPGVPPAGAPEAATVCAPDIGHYLPRRLSNEEYLNSVRDIFGLQATPAITLPAQGRGSFSNNAEALIVDAVTFDS